MFKRFLCLALCLLLAVPAAMAEDTAPTYTLVGYDNTEYRDWKTNLFFTRMEEKTGVHFELTQYTDQAKWTDAKKAMLQGNDLPDVLFKAALTTSECISLREAGVLIDLLPLLEENCPNLWAILQEHPDYLDAITLPDGSVAALPFITDTPMQNYMWINNAWLSKLGLSMPTTAEELTQVLTAFRNKDPNKNGKADEIPLGFLGAFDLKFLAHAFGLVANDYNVFAKDGQVRFMPLEENYRAFVEWCHEMYAAGLFDKEGFSTSNTLRMVTDKDAIATYGVILTPVAGDLFRVTWASDYTILAPLTYDGKQIYRDFMGPVLRGTFAVTGACAEPEKMLQWVDMLYSEEGSVLATVGLENTDFVVDGDGTWRLTEAASQDTFFTVASLIDGGATLPGVLAGDFQRRYSGSGDLTATLTAQQNTNSLAVRPFPYYSLTAQQAEEITALQNEIGYYVDMQLARWVLGEEEISDDTFTAFAQHLQELGLDNFLQFWQNILDN